MVTLKGGSIISDEIAVADAHPLGARPFKRPDYIRKFRTLAEFRLQSRTASSLPSSGCRHYGPESFRN